MTNFTPELLHILKKKKPELLFKAFGTPLMGGDRSRRWSAWILASMGFLRRLWSSPACHEFAECVALEMLELFHRRWRRSLGEDAFCKLLSWCTNLRILTKLWLQPGLCKFRFTTTESLPSSVPLPPSTRSSSCVSRYAMWVLLLCGLIFGVYTLI